LQELDAETILDMEGFELLAVIAVVEAAIGEHAIHVEEQQADLAGGGFRVQWLYLIK